MSRNWTAILAIMFLGVILSATACSGGSKPSNPKTGISVVATTTEMGALTQEVAKNLASVKTLVGPGVDPHDFEPGPSDLAAISDADVIIRNGIGLDDWLNRTINSGGGKAKTVTATNGVPIRKVAGHEDPHVWHNPENDKIIVANIANALAKADPKHATEYQTNAKAYEARLDEVDKQVRAIIDTIPLADRKMVTDHDAFGYFIERYGLTYIGAVIPSTSTQAESSAKQVAALEEVIKKEHVKAIFSESTANPKVAKQIADDTGAKIIDNLYGDSLGTPGSGAATVDGMILANAKVIAEALK